MAQHCIFSILKARFDAAYGLLDMVHGIGNTFGYQGIGTRYMITIA